MSHCRIEVNGGETFTDITRKLSKPVWTVAMDIAPSTEFSAEPGRICAMVSSCRLMPAGSWR
jgi:hypothetical protein